MIDLMTLCAFNAAYAMTIDSDTLEEWPEYFAEETHYRVFATGFYKDKFVKSDAPASKANSFGIVLKERIAVCDSTVTDTLLALPL